LGKKWRPLEQKTAKKIFVEAVNATRKDYPDFNPEKKGIFEFVKI